SGGVEPYNYSWTFGDGGTSFSQSPVYSYTDVGTYTVTLVVTDSMTTSRSDQLSIEVTDEGINPSDIDDGISRGLLIALAVAIPLVAVMVVAVILIARRRASAEGRLRAPEDVSGTKAADHTQPPVKGQAPLIRVEDKLFQLRTMKEKGQITEEEYDARLKELLEKW
ncbi:MAG TPA: PKD domain-containing protein, partial [Thermoplasmata archaeon]|nr:PKD domain-containing protein [Thermoplasmata archaeon]